jgi:hypothetical protein
VRAPARLETKRQRADITESCALRVELALWGLGLNSREVRHERNEP